MVTKERSVIIGGGRRQTDSRVTNINNIERTNHRKHFKLNSYSEPKELSVNLMMRLSVEEECHANNLGERMRGRLTRISLLALSNPDHFIHVNVFVIIFFLSPPSLRPLNYRRIIKMICSWGMFRLNVTDLQMKLLAVKN